MKNLLVAVACAIGLAACANSQAGKAGALKYNLDVKDDGSAVVTLEHDPCGEVLRAKGQVNAPQAACAAATEAAKAKLK